MKFADVENKPGYKGRGCVICGARNKGGISIQLSELGPQGSRVGGRHIRAKSVSLCEEHAVSIFLALEASLLRAIGREEPIET